jgi:hypothetical protein
MTTFKKTWIAVLPTPLFSLRKSDAKSATQNRPDHFASDTLTENVLASLGSAGLLRCDGSEARAKAARMISFAIELAVKYHGGEDTDRLDWLEKYFPPLDPLTKNRLKRNWRRIIDDQIRKKQVPIERANLEKYRRLKAQLRTGARLSREDFLFVKTRDLQANKERKKMLADRGPQGGVGVCGGYNTAPR